MYRICPNPIPWNDVYKKLSLFAGSHQCKPPKPPLPLILAGWVYSNDYDKMERWQQTVEWAEANGCAEITEVLKEKDFYFSHDLSDYDVGPLGSPMYLEWNFESKIKPSDEELLKVLDRLCSSWEQTAGPELAAVTYPLGFSGAKRRKLLVRALQSFSPPWGGWVFLSHDNHKRRAFTRFRESVNKVIAPHMVDHIEFVLVPAEDDLV